MHRAKKKKPGELAAARARHVGRQRTYDQLKAVRAGTTDTLRLHGKTYRVEAADWGEDYAHVVYVAHGRICTGHMYRDEDRVMSEDQTHLVPSPRVVARILEVVS